MNPYSVVIPSCNIGNLTACVAAIRAAGETCRVIVVWDGETGSDEANGLYMALCMSPIRDSMTGPPYPPLPASFVEPGVKPFIFARNVNIGIRAAGTDDVCLMNDDALLSTPYGIGKLWMQSVEHPEYGAICPSFTPESVGTRNLVWCGRTTLAEEHVMLVFACVYIPRSTIDRVGLLDERFGVNAGGKGARGYGLEDDDYSLRIRQAGLKLGVYDGVLVDHVPESTGLNSTFRHDPEHPHDVRAHEELFRKIHGHWPEGHGFPGRSK